MICDLPLGGAAFALAGEIPELARERLAPFRCGRAPTLRLTFQRRPTPSPLEEPHADVLGIWRRRVEGASERIDIFIRHWSRIVPAVSATLEGNAAAVDLHPGAPEPFVSMSVVDILLQILAVEALARTGGLLLHASAVCASGELTLFAADSGVGKSTAAGHCARAGAARVCEDRTALELAPDAVRAWPTPFQSRDLPPGSPGPVRAIHLLARADSPRIEPLDHRTAAQRLLANAFAPFWDRGLLERSLAAAVELCLRVPVARLHLRDEPDFVPLALEGRHAAA